MSCPCGTGLDLEACCGRFLAGAVAPTAVDLMRSRYTAYVVENEAHLLATWHPAHRPASLRFADDQEWHDLEILHSTGGSMFDTDGTVAFVATYTAAGSRRRLTEHSRFARLDGRWFYVDAVDAEVQPG